jgi:hypothetical protein
MRGIRQLFTLVMVLALMMSCGRARHQRQMAVLHLADSLSNDYPARAYDSLMADTALFRDAGKAIRMRYLLTMANAQNKAAVPFRNDSIMKMVTDYYDSHGSANEVMTAHYLLGCVYRDLGEAPEALECFNDAEEKADTADDDCDYATLYKIYGQMSVLFHQQDMPSEELKTNVNVYKYALKAKDTLNAIRAYELSIRPYYTMHNYDKVLSVTSEAHRMYKHFGYEKDAAGVYGTAIYIYLERKEYNKADSLMKIFESRSDMFNNNDDIKAGHEIYYYSKGSYYLGTGKADSARYYFLKTLLFGNYEAGYRGMLDLYKKINNADSIAKYAVLFAAANDSTNSNINTENVARVASLYKYNRAQNIANEKMKEMYWLKVKTAILYTTIAIILIIFVLIIVFLRQKIKRKIKAYKNLYTDAIVKYIDAKEELATVVDDKNTFIENKRQEIAELNRQLEDYRIKNKSQKAINDEKAFSTSEIVNHFREMAKPTLNASHPTERDWSKLVKTFTMLMPNAYSSINGQLLSKKELCTSIMLILNFSEAEINNLTSSSPQSTTNMKSKINTKLYSDKSASSLKDNLLKSIKNGNRTE